MKKSAIVLAAALMMPSTVFAAKYGLAGCGLGSIVFGSDPGFVQVFAATTNGTFGSQTFGITTGTSNCDGSDAAVARIQQKDFVRVNYANLSRDAATGGGEYLAAMATLMGCGVDAQTQFADVAHKNHSELFPAEADASTVVNNLRTVVAKDANLAMSCTLI